MSTKQVLLRFGACLALLALDRLLATLAIETNAAGALLSPGGGVALEAFAIALAFLGVRLAFVVVFCGAVAWTTADAVRYALSQSKRS